MEIFQNLKHFLEGVQDIFMSDTTWKIGGPKGQIEDEYLCILIFQ
jgi:hypothetical protein